MAYTSFPRLLHIAHGAFVATPSPTTACAPDGAAVAAAEPFVTPRPSAEPSTCRVVAAHGALVGGSMDLAPPPMPGVLGGTVEAVGRALVGICCRWVHGADVPIVLVLTPWRGSVSGVLHGAWVPAVALEGASGVPLLSDGVGVWLATCTEGAVAVALGSRSQLKREPKGKCCTTGNLERTSAMYIFSMPCFFWSVSCQLAFSCLCCREEESVRLERKL